MFHVPFPEQFEGLFQFRVGCHGRRKIVCDIKVGRSFFQSPYVHYQVREPSDRLLGAVLLSETVFYPLT
ncbi:hypothetical protein MMALV_13040 [Candidatus Methanomethylophilus alvi Mx1201]|uniref:Uncharacterized protein n=1 Tax=Methanomethylophilus alvi (strain Mx1201) TaxID=1236689 RepID=M9SEA6_METAX|nr:hypothetical protein MMALV_13040 [Candidatus Methanomethylophilus alvi Mx1201]